MAIQTDFNVGAGVSVARKLLKCYVNVGTSGTKEWEIVGKGIEDSTMNLNSSTEGGMDILGHNNKKVTKWEPSQSFDPFTVEGGSKLAFKLHDIWLRKAPEELSQFEVMITYEYIGTETDGYEAEIQKDCTIDITSIGGSAYVDMPIEISFSNDSTRGLVKYSEGKPTFTTASEE